MFLSQKNDHSFWVIQKYLEKPLLYKDRKFDIRVWALFTSKNEVFFYKTGYVRTSSNKFTLKDGNNYVHLTNNCLQQFNNAYGKYEEGNTIDLLDWIEYLRKIYPDYEIDLEKHFLKKMKSLIIDTFLANKNKFNPGRRKNCFEFFGYDFMIDEDLRTWLIEVFS